ncbi:MAG: hypothetical protein AAGA80_10825 [Cyanobacteria bacterium P01_F01_bin.143]
MKSSRFFPELKKCRRTLGRRWFSGLTGFCSICTLGFLFLYFQKPIIQPSVGLELSEIKVDEHISKINSKFIPKGTPFYIDFFQNKLPISYIPRNRIFNLTYQKEIENISDIPVLSYAIIPNQKISTYTSVYFGVFALGLLGAVTIVYILETFDQSLKTITETKKIFDHSLEDNSPKEYSAEFWETTIPISVNLQYRYPNSEFNLRKLRDIDRDELTEIIIHCQKNLDDSIQLVQEQEDELFIKKYYIRKLQRKVNIANNLERYSLENQLKEEEELGNLLKATLIGQRRTLKKKSKILLQYRQLLEEKQFG